MNRPVSSPHEVAVADGAELVALVLEKGAVDGDEDRETKEELVSILNSVNAGSSEADNGAVDEAGILGFDSVDVKGCVVTGTTSPVEYPGSEPVGFSTLVEDSEGILGSVEGAELGAKGSAGEEVCSGCMMSLDPGAKLDCQMYSAAGDGSESRREYEWLMNTEAECRTIHLLEIAGLLVAGAWSTEVAGSPAQTLVQDTTTPSMVAVTIAPTCLAWRRLAENEGLDVGLSWMAAAVVTDAPVSGG